MRIVYFITRSDTLGGAQNHVRDLAVRMKTEGHEPIVIVGGRGNVIDLLQDEGLHVIALSELTRGISLFGDITSLVKMVSHLKRIKPDLVALHSVKAGALGRIACAFVRCRCVYTAHGWSHIRTARGVAKGLLGLVERLLARLTDRVIVVCKADYQYAIEEIGIREEKLTIIYNGVMSVDMTGCCSEKNSPTKLVTVARFQKPKDHLTLFRALKEIEQDEWVLQCVGDGPELSEAKIQVAELGLANRVVFLGYRERVSEILCSSDIFVLSSRSEGFPISIIEAMRAALPVVASNVGGIPESVADGKTGYLVAPGDVPGMADRLDRLINDPTLRVKFGLTGLKLYDKKFSLDAMFYKTLRLYEAVCAA